MGRRRPGCAVEHGTGPRRRGPKPPPEPWPTRAPMNTISLGARGDDVRDVQSRLAGLGYAIDAEEHGVFGATTQRAVREFQQRRQLIVDGLVGEDTWQELVEAARTLGDRVLYLRSPSYRGDDVRDLQGRLNLLGFDAGRED